MGNVERLARDNNMWPSSISYESIHSMWVQVHPTLVENYVKNEQTRIRELNWKSMYNQTAKKKIPAVVENAIATEHSS